MTFPLRRARRVGTSALAVVVAAYLSVAFVYHSLNIFTPPERIKSLGRTYMLSNTPQLSLDELSDRRSPSFTRYNTFERVGTLLPDHPIYQWQSDVNRGHATSDAYLEWGNRYVSYGILGAP
ncbi:hypothetical protein [Rhodococcus sp. ACT016]|uniref:hypothetical protein n=1 Tax=Rhodococcus sp. ACT016 TaxID=3134808 RepID=UPI003D2B4575